MTHDLPQAADPVPMMHQPLAASSRGEAAYKKRLLLSSSDSRLLTSDHELFTNDQLLASDPRPQILFP